MKLYAVSDLHLGCEENRRALCALPPSLDDWLILAGDVGEGAKHMEFAFETLSRRFCQILWVPGNHELWTIPSAGNGARGQFKYEQLVALCRAYGVLTPEDPYPIATFGQVTARIVPLFLLYDYSFAPDGIPPHRAVEWASEAGAVCADEALLHPDPYASKADWCHARCVESERRLGGYRDQVATVLVNHFPLRRSLAWLPRLPRFSVWCGTRRTEDWHIRFNARVVVSGHLHIRSTRMCDGVRFEEVSLGYPQQWTARTTLTRCIREILPGQGSLETRTVAEGSWT